MKPARPLIAFLGSSLGIITVSILGSTGLVAQTWTNSTTGTGNWSTATNWDTDPLAPVSSATTAVQFFATPGTVIPAASAIVANQDIAAPMILNSLTINGSGPGSGAAPALTISGGAIQFAGTGPVLNVNAGYGTVGYTVNLNSSLDFAADTAINFSTGGAPINMGTAVAFSGAGKVTFTGGLINRPLSLTAAGTLTGDMVLGGSSSVLQLNKNHSILGTNAATTQSVTVASGSGVNLAYGNAAYTQPQNFVVNGDGNASTTGAAINATRINFGNGAIGGLALASDSTVRMAMEVASEARFVTISRGLVGTGKLTKMGNGYLQPSVTSPASVTWGGTAYSAFTGDVEIKEGVIQTPAASNVLGSNTATTQRVTVSSGAAMVVAAGNNAWTQPQNFIINGSGTGYIGNTGGIAALDSFGVGFGSNTIRTIVLASDASVSVRRDATSNGPQHGLNVTAGLAGAGNLTIGSNYGQPISPLYVNAASAAFAEFPAFSGKVIINNGILNIGNVNSLGTSTTGQVTLSGLGTLSSSIAGGLDQAFLDRIANLSTTSGTIALGVASSNNLDFTTAPNARLGAIASYTYSGTITPAGSTYRLGGGGGTLTVSSQLTAGNSVVITGGVVLTNPSNDFSGGITIAGNNTGLGQGATLSLTGGIGSLPANAISFGGIGGTLAYTGAPGGTIQSLGALAFTTGHATVSSTYGTSGNTGISYSSLTRTAGATGNFATANSTSGVTANPATDIITAAATAVMTNGSVVTLGGTAPTGLTAGTQYFVVNASGNTYQLATTSGGPAIDFSTAGTNVTQTVIGTNGTLNKISVAGLATGFVNKGVFFNDFNYAYNDAAGFLRTPAYGTDPGFATSGATASVANAAHQNISGSLSAQINVTFTTLKIAGAFGVTLATDQVMTVDGILKSGSNAGTISGAGTLAGIRASSGAEMVIRPYSSGDTLTISTPILDNGASSLTKSGAGTLTLTAANTYTGITTVAAGTLTVSGTGSLEDSAPVTITGGTYNVSVNDTVGAVTLRNGAIGSTSILTGSGYAVENGTVSARLAGTGALVKSTSGQVILSGVNTYEGGTSITGGTLAVTGAGRLYDSGSISISGGGIYDVGGSDIVGGITLTNGTIRGAGALNASFYNVENGTISAPLAGTGTITKSTGGTVTLAGVNTAVSDVVVDAGTLVLADNAKLNFAINGLFTNSITGTGTVTLDGDFGINLSLADLTPGNTWTLVNAATLTESFGPTFNIPGFTEAANVWTKVDGLNKWTFTEATGVLKLSGLASYSSWITGFGLPAIDQDPTDDPDYDGISNLMEYVLFNGQPAVPATTILPTLDASGANFIFTIYRRTDSATDTTQLFQYGTDMTSWTDVAIPGGAGVTVTANTPDPGIDRVEISVAKGLNTRLFGRLKVTQP